MGISWIGCKCKPKDIWLVFMIWYLFSVLMLLVQYSIQFEWKYGITLYPHGFIRNSSAIMSLFPVGKSEENLPYDKNSSSANYDLCSGRYIYIHELPSRFNSDIIKSCSSLMQWTDMCKSLINGGFGPRASESGGVLQEESWFATDQFSLEVIFHNRMKRYKCLTNESSLASAIYVPFYAGLDVSRYLWDSDITARDASAHDFANWISKQAQWKHMLGRDHFIVTGRIIWDFKRQTDSGSDWGSNLLLLPEGKNMTVLTIESSPWSTTDIAIPYPTYFHPSSQEEVQEWQKKIKRIKRPYLYTFVGAPRPNMHDSIRGMIIDQCLASREKCKLLDCNLSSNNCYDPGHVMKTFLNSRFCLQPSGDSYTRRSTFDSILGGCIPVFFNSGSAYAQYVSYLPENHSEYSVFIPESAVRDGKTSIQEVLMGISEEEVEKMHEEVIRLIPKVIYVDTSSGLNTSEDAFDIAIKKVLERLNTARRQMKLGKNS